MSTRSTISSRACSRSSACSRSKPVRLRYLEAVTAAALGAAAACYLYLAWQLPVPRYTVASTPGFLPLVLGTLMLGLCAALLGKALFARDEQGDTVVAFSPIGLAKIAGVLVALVGYVLLLEPLGFLLSSFLFLVAVAPLFGFVVVLRLRLPPGLLPL